jgi:hypothetical protein
MPRGSLSHCRAMHTRTVTLAELPAAFEALCGNARECKVIVDPTA